MSRTIRNLSFLLVLVPSAAAFAAGDGAFEEYLAHALREHPVLEAQRARIEVVEADARLAGSLPDLKLAWGEMLVPVETRVGPQRRVLSVAQAFPWPGTLDLKERSGLAAAGSAREMLRANVAGVEHAVRKAWNRLALTRVEKRIVARHLDLARQAETASRAAYESGAGGSAPILAAQMEVAELEARRRGLADRLVAEHSALAAAAGRSAGAEAPRAELPEAPEAALPGRERLLEMMDRANPSLAALARRQEEQRLRSELAGFAGRPEFSVGLDWIVTGEARRPDLADSGRDPVVARMAVRLPLWSGRSGAEQDAAAGRLAAVASERRDLRLDLAARLDGILYRLRSTERDLRLHEESLLPRMRQRVRTAEADLAADRSEWNDLLAERRQLLQLELGSSRARHALVQAREDLALLLNTPWEEITRAAGPIERESES